MSLHNLAKKVQQTGRGNDSMLVHMSPREVQGLQALAVHHGGSLTRNPKTGLPEAGFLEDILPIVAAGAATYFTAGAAAPLLASSFGAAAPFIAGAGAGALIGGGSAAIQGKDVGQGALMGGITGLATGAMGSMMGGAPAGDFTMGAVAPTGADVAAAGLATGQSATVNAPVQAAGQAAANIPTQAQFTPTPTPPIPPTQAGIQAASLPAGEARNAALEQLVQNQGAGVPQPSMQQYVSDMGMSNTGFKGALTPEEIAAQNMKDPNASWWSKQTPWEKAGYSTLGAALLAGFNAPPNKNGAPQDNYQSPLKRISPNFQAQAPIQPNPYYRAQYPVYAAQGGLMSAYQTGGPVERMTQANTAMNPQGGLYPQGMIDKTQYATPTQRPTSLEVVESEPSYDARVNPMTGTLMAGGGLADLGAYSDGGRLLKGPGDGMSDNIPAQIGSKQPARLADGEFVVPADVVSHLGNGSTDAGAKRLYAMMDKVRTARTGKKKQAPAVNMNKYLPV
jgi:hypothetical protein